jgi:hypothetical protein
MQVNKLTHNLSSVAELVQSGTEAKELMAYQIAFDLCESDMQHFRESLSPFALTKTAE